MLYNLLSVFTDFNSRKDSPQTSKSSVSSAESEVEMRDSPDQESYKDQFKKFGPSSTRRSQRLIPQRLREVPDPKWNRSFSTFIMIISPFY